MYEFLFLFMIYAIIGWIWETPYVSIGQKKFINRGFLRGPYIPIYGLACITIVYSIRLLPPFEVSALTVLFVILFVSLVSGVWEYATSWTLEKLFKMRWWDYSDHKYNINGRVCLDYAILFGIGGFILWYFVNPQILELYNRLDGIALFILLTVFYGIFMIDAAYTLRGLIQIRTILIKFEMVKDELNVKYDEVMKQISESKNNTIVQINEFLVSIKEISNSELGKIKASVRSKIDTIQELIGASKTNTTRLFAKFPKSSFSLKNFISESNKKRGK